MPPVRSIWKEQMMLHGRMKLMSRSDSDLRPAGVIVPMRVSTKPAMM